MKELVNRPGIDLELRNNMQRTPLHLAAQRGSMEICQILCSFKELDRNAKDVDENTPLHLASKLGHIACVIYLVKDAGCDVQLKNKDGQMPYDLAFNIEVRDIFEKLFRQLNLQGDK